MMMISALPAPPAGAATALIKFALDAGGADNITVVLAPLPLGALAQEPPHPPLSPASGE